MHTTCTAVSAIIKEFPPLMPSHSLSKYPTIHWLDFVDGARDVKKCTRSCMTYRVKAIYKIGVDSLKESTIVLKTCLVQMSKKSNSI